MLVERSAGSICCKPGAVGGGASESDGLGSVGDNGAAEEVVPDGDCPVQGDKSQAAAALFARRVGRSSVPDQPIRRDRLEN